MDRYQRVEKPREEAAIGPNEIRITAQGRTRNYISYALTLLQVNHRCLLLTLGTPRFYGAGEIELFFFGGDFWLGFSVGSVRRTNLVGSNLDVSPRCWLGGHPSPTADVYCF